MRSKLKLLKVTKICGKRSSWKASAGQVEFRFFNRARCCLPKVRKVLEDSREMFLKLYLLKQIHFLKSYHWTSRKQFLQLRRKSFARNLKNCPSKSEKDYQSNWKKISFPQIIHWTTWLDFWLPHRKPLPNSQNFLVNQLQKNQRFFRFLFFKKSCGYIEFSFVKLDEKTLPKDCFLSKSKIRLKKSFLWKIFCPKGILWTRRWKCSLDNSAECCSPELWNFFDRSG